MCGIGGLAHGMSWKKNPQPWELSSTPWELSSTASIFDGAGDRKKEMLRKKYHVVRKKTHVVRKIFYVASIFDGEASRQNRPPPFHFSTPDSPSIAPHRFAQGPNRDRQPRARAIQKAAIQAKTASFCNILP